jgi:hypothetical protein
VRSVEEKDVEWIGNEHGRNERRRMVKVMKKESGMLKCGRNDSPLNMYGISTPVNS